jgi:cysteine synthase
MKKFVLGPTFEEMLHPEKINPNIRKKAWEMRNKDPLDPINLYNITWKNINNDVYYVVLPKELTGVDANIIYLYGSEFPSESHKVGATYSILMELVLKGEVDPSYHTLVWPSTGNYGIGGAWVGCRMKFDTVVILPEEMSKERFDLIEEYGARVIATPGCESNVKEIYDKAKELKAADPDRVRILNQFSEFGNYRFHYYVTGNTILELMNQLKLGNGRIAAIVAGVGSGGTIACGDRIKEVFPDTKNVALEPVQCPTISLNGYGGHDIQGIGDKHVTWIHNVMNNDAVVAVDDIESKKMLQVLTDPVGKTFLKKFLKDKDVETLSKTLGISSVANIIGAIKMAKYYNMTSEDNIVTIATDNIDRYRTVMDQLTKDYGELTQSEAKHRYESMFLDAKTDWIFEGTMDNRKRWHNLKYYTWVEQQNKTVEELDSQKTKEFWKKEQNEVKNIDKLLLEYRKKN